MTQRYEYQQAETIVKRLFRADVIQRDRFAIIHRGNQVAELDYQRARQLWLGRVDLAELLRGASDGDH